MARTARVKEAFGTYYVTQTSSGARPLFMNDDDRRYFIELLQRAVNKFNCRIIDYCAQSNSTYHLIIDVNGGDLSKIMKSINIPYAMHAACEGHLFKDRYKSRTIENEEDLKASREAIKAQTCTESGFSSFCVSEIVPCSDENDGQCTECISCSEDAFQWISKQAMSLEMTVPELMKNKPERNRVIREIRRNSTLSLKAIGEAFGGLSESSVSKILNTD